MLSLLISAGISQTFEPGEFITPLSAWTWERIIEKRKQKNNFVVLLYEETAYSNFIQDVKTFESIAKKVKDRLHFFYFNIKESESIKKRYGLEESSFPQIFVFRGTGYNIIPCNPFSEENILNQLSFYIKPCFDYYKPEWLTEHANTALYLSDSEWIPSDFKIISCEYDNIIRFNHTINASIVQKISDHKTVLVLQNRTVTSVIESPYNATDLTLAFHIHKNYTESPKIDFYSIDNISELCDEPAPFCVYAQMEVPDVQVYAMAKKYNLSNKIPFFLGKRSWDLGFEVLEQGSYFLLSSDVLSYRQIKPDEYLNDVIKLCLKSKGKCGWKEFNHSYENFEENFTELIDTDIESIGEIPPVGVNDSVSDNTNATNIDDYNEEIIIEEKGSQNYGNEHNMENLELVTENDILITDYDYGFDEYNVDDY